MDKLPESTNSPASLTSEPEKLLPVIRETDAPCEACGKPVEVGQVVLCYDDAGEMHADCERPFALDYTREDGEPEPVVLLGSPMRHVALSRLSSPVSGTDMVMVPREPTEAVVEAGVEFMISHRLGSKGWPTVMRACWRAMLAAAPASPTPPIPMIAEAGERERCKLCGACEHDPDCPHHPVYDMLDSPAALSTPATLDNTAAEIDWDRIAKVIDNIDKQAEVLEHYAEQDGHSGKAPASVYHWNATHFRDIAADLRRRLPLTAKTEKAE